MKKAVFPGSFDPYTKGHEDVVEKAIDLFDKVYVAIGVNESKKYLFETQKRVNHINAIYENEDRVQVIPFTGLTIDLCKELDASHIVRGVRNPTDFDYEFKIAQMNKDISGIDTVMFFTSPEVMAINSSIIRELAKNGANIEQFVTNAHLLTL